MKRQIIIEIEGDNIEELTDKVIRDLNFLLGMRKEKIRIILKETTEE
jgi:hypothetical protein